MCVVTVPRPASRRHSLRDDLVERHIDKPVKKHIGEIGSPVRLNFVVTWPDLNMFQATTCIESCKPEQVHFGGVILATLREIDTCSPTSSTSGKVECAIDNAKDPCTNDQPACEIKKEKDDKKEFSISSPRATSINDPRTPIDLLDLTPCEQCSSAFENALDVWMDHLVDRHPTPERWPSTRAVEYDHPYTTVVCSSKKRRSHSIPRPLNSFMIFAQYIRRVTLRWFPEAHNVHISQRVGYLWRHMPAEIREEYAREAVRLQKLHSFEFPDYKYRPKKRLCLPPKVSNHSCVSVDFGEQKYARTHPLDGNVCSQSNCKLYNPSATVCSSPSVKTQHKVPVIQRESSPIGSFLNDSAHVYKATSIQTGTQLYGSGSVEKIHEKQFDDASGSPVANERLLNNPGSIFACESYRPTWATMKSVSLETLLKAPSEFTIQAILTEPLEVVTQPAHLLTIPQATAKGLIERLPEDGLMIHCVDEYNRKASDDVVPSALTPSISSMSPDSFSSEPKPTGAQPASMLPSALTVCQQITKLSEESKVESNHTELDWNVYTVASQNHTAILTSSCQTPHCNVLPQSCSIPITRGLTPNLDLADVHFSPQAVSLANTPAEFDFMTLDTISNFSESSSHVWQRTEADGLMSIPPYPNEFGLNHAEKYLPSIESWTFGPLPSR